MPEARIASKDDAKVRIEVGPEVELLLTRYDKGNAFARAMLAGLGQIHIDGKVKLLEMPEDIEMTLVDGVASALTGQTEQSK